MPRFLQKFSVFLVFLCAFGAALACVEQPCDKTKCPLQTLNCTPGRSILDLCGCCQVCLQGINQTCGGLNGEVGRCEPGLECVFNVEEGQLFESLALGSCQDISQTVCTLSNSWGCLLTHTSTCVCLNVSTCHVPATFPFIALEECHDFLSLQHEAIELKNCSREPCPTSITKPERGPCPDDSYQIMGKNNNQYQDCECLPSACQTVKCSEGLHPKIFRNGSKIPGSCCTLFQCVNVTDMVCHYEDKLYMAGEHWNADVCTRCSCENGVTRCQVISCDLSKKCGYMVVPDNECCPVCDGCISPSGKFLKNGVVWKEDDCTTCQCQEGKMNCQAEMCQTSCAKPRIVQGHCCPLCDEKTPVESATGSPMSNALTPSLEMCRGDGNRRYGMGEMWFDGCRHCYCQNGREMCAVLTCGVLHCDHPRLLPGNCCPTCSKKIVGRERPYSLTVCQAVDGHYHVEGETWSLDPCTWCLCMQGQVLCQATQCPPTPCPHPLHHLGSCCSTCTNLSSTTTNSGIVGTQLALSNSVCYGEDGATVYGEGQRWRPTPCQSCICLKGKVQCFRESCPPIEDCPHPMLVKHRCCPVCLGGKSSRSMLCLQDGRAYRDGERWSVNDCTSCVCMKGMQMCTEKICSPWCPRPLRLPGQCCPICEGESLDLNGASGQSAPHSQQPLSLAMVIICATIMVLLLVVVVFLVMVVLRQRRMSNRSKGGLCLRGQRPKSTNLELQGMSPCSKPLLDSAELKRFHDQGNPIMKNMVNH